MSCFLIHLCSSIEHSDDIWLATETTFSPNNSWIQGVDSRSKPEAPVELESDPGARVL